MIMNRTICLRFKSQLLFNNEIYINNNQYKQIIIAILDSIDPFMICDTPTFLDATNMFYSNQYENGLKLISDCIQQDSNNSILYSNRALFYSQLDKLEQAYQDLNRSIYLNRLNYIAYFNLFSLLIRNDRLPEAFDSLCCALSCIYLIRAKDNKSQIDVSKSIKYSENNMQAHVLKGLINLQNGKYKLALNELDWACQISPNNQTIKNIRNLIFVKMNPGLSIDQNKSQQEQQRMINDKNNPLLNSYSYDPQNLQKEIKDKVIEFNEVYNNLNDTQGTVTQKVPKDMQIQNQSQKVYPVQNEEEGQKQENINQKTSFIQVQHSQFTFQNQQKTGQFIIHQKSVNESNHSVLQQNLLSDPQPHILVPNQSHNSSFNQKNETQNNTELNKSMNDKEVTQDDAILIADDGLDTPSQQSYAPEPGYYGNSQNNVKDELMSNQIHYHNVVQCVKTDKFSQIQSQNQQNNENQFQSFLSHQDEQLSQISLTSKLNNALYPVPHDCLLQISIISVQITGRSLEELQKMNDIYCIANYYLGSPGYKFRTVCKKSNNRIVDWNQVFEAVQIPELPESMRIKVYNKKYSSYRDDLIGQIQVQVLTHGLVKLPLYQKNGQLSGALLMNLQLQSKPILEEQDNEEFK